MATFFTDWELWLKLVFLLACGIAVTVTAGYTKVVITNWRMKRQKSELQAEEKENVWLVGRHHDEEYGDATRGSLPFGARALQSGVAIEGIWTPHSQTPDRFSESLSRQRDTRTSAVVDRTDSTIHKTNSAVQSIDQPRKDRPIMTIASEPAIDADDLSLLNSTHHNQLITGNYSLFMLHNPEYAKAMADIETEYQASKKEEAILAKSFVDLISSPQLVHRHSDLSMLDRQRRGQAAETGQLAPRMRRGHSSPP